MEPKILEQISTKIDELNALLDTANARAMDNDEVRSKQLLSTKLHSISGEAPRDPPRPPYPLREPHWS